MSTDDITPVLANAIWHICHAKVHSSGKLLFSLYLNFVAW